MGLDWSQVRGTLAHDLIECTGYPAETSRLCAGSADMSGGHSWGVSERTPSVLKSMIMRSMHNLRPTSRIAGSLRDDLQKMLHHRATRLLYEGCITGGGSIPTYYLSCFARKLQVSVLGSF